MILRQTLLYLPAQLIGPLAQFVAVLAWTHWLLPSDYGFISLLLAVQELAFTLCMSWWTLYTVRYLPGLADRAAYEAGENAVIALAALAQVPVVLGALALTGHLDAPGLAAATLAFTLSRTINMHLSERARSLGDIATYTAIQIAGPVFGFGLGLALMQVWPAALAVIAGYAIVQTAILPALWWRLEMRARLSWRLEGGLLRAALLYGLPLLAAGGFGWVSVNGIRLVVERLDGLVLLGLLSVGWNLGQRLIGVAGSLVTAAAFPLAVRRAAQAGVDAGITQIGFAAILILGLLMPSAFGLIAVSEPFVRLFVGAEFQEATLTVLPLAALAAAIRNLRVHTADQVFMIAERPGFLLALNGTEAIATIVLCAVGLKFSGLTGACLGVLAATTGGAIACIGLAHRRYGFVISPAAVIRLAAACAVMTVVVALDIYPAGAIGLALRVATGGIVYLALAALLMRGRLQADALPVNAPARSSSAPRQGAPSAAPEPRRAAAGRTPRSS